MAAAYSENLRLCRDAAFITLSASGFLQKLCFPHKANGVFWKISSRESIWSFSAIISVCVSCGNCGGITVVHQSQSSLMINPACSVHTAWTHLGVDEITFGPSNNNYHDRGLGFFLKCDLCENKYRYSNHWADWYTCSLVIVANLLLFLLNECNSTHV